MKIETYHEAKIHFHQHEVVRVSETVEHLLKEGYKLIKGKLIDGKIQGVSTDRKDLLVILRSKY